VRVVVLRVTRLPSLVRIRLPQTATLFPYTTLFRSWMSLAAAAERWARVRTSAATTAKPRPCSPARAASTAAFRARMLVWKAMPRSEEHTSELQSRENLVCRLLLEKKKSCQHTAVLA